MTDDIYRSQFRLPYGLYEELKRVADNNHRSLNAEVVDRLTRSLGLINLSKDADFPEAPAEMTETQLLERLDQLAAENLQCLEALKARRNKK